jgi:hypothetical protein
VTPETDCSRKVYNRGMAPEPVDSVVDQEIEAIHAVLRALTPLSEKARTSVLTYVTKRLGTELPSVSDNPSIPATPEVPKTEAGGSAHISALKETKKPRSANEMAALVGYYLASLPSGEGGKKTINRKDIETYFTIAEFPLPLQIPMTLANAKAAGYFDLVGNGEYKLNAVGHNLVVHSMPRGSGSAPKPSKKSSKRKASKK